MVKSPEKFALFWDIEGLENSMWLHFNEKFSLPTNYGGWQFFSKINLDQAVETSCIKAVYFNIGCEVMKYPISRQ